MRIRGRRVSCDAVAMRDDAHADAGKSLTIPWGVQFGGTPNAFVGAMDKEYRSETRVRRYP